MPAVWAPRKPQFCAKIRTKPGLAPAANSGTGPARAEPDELQARATPCPARARKAARARFRGRREGSWRLNQRTESRIPTRVSCARVPVQTRMSPELPEHVGQKLIPSLPDIDPAPFIQQPERRHDLYSGASSHVWTVRDSSPADPCRRWLQHPSHATARICVRAPRPARFLTWVSLHTVG
jgi:hypothetical protein